MNCPELFKESKIVAVREEELLGKIRPSISFVVITSTKLGIVNKLTFTLDIFKILYYVRDNSYTVWKHLEVKVKFSFQNEKQFYNNEWFKKYKLISEKKVCEKIFLQKRGTLR